MRNGKTGEAKASRREFLKGVSTPVVLSGDWVQDEDGGFWSDWFGDDKPGDVEVYGGTSEEKEEIYPDGKGLFYAYDEDAWYKQTENEYEWKLSTVGGGVSHWESDTQGVLSPKNDEAISVERQLNEVQQWDYSDQWPQPLRQPEASGGPGYQAHPDVENPVITAADVTDFSTAEFVADPFLAYEDGIYYCIHEVRHDDDGDGTDNTDIVFSTSMDGLEWTYQRALIVGDAPTMSYPFPLKWNDEWYIMPSGDLGGEFWIYKVEGGLSTDMGEANVTRIKRNNIPGMSTTGDPTLIPYDPETMTWGPDDNFYWFLMNNDSSTNSEHLFYQQGRDAFLKDNWKTHPSSPFQSNDAAWAKVSGRPIVREDSVDIFWQDLVSDRMLRTSRITDLTTSTFTHHKRNTRVLESNGGDRAWNSGGMHHIDPMMAGNSQGADIAIVDGQSNTSQGFALGVYTTAKETYPHAVSVGKSSSQSFSSGTSAVVTWDNSGLPKLDQGEIFDFTNNKYVAPKDGIYRVNVQTNFDVASSAAYPFGSKVTLYNRTTAKIVTEDHMHHATEFMKGGPSLSLTFPLRKGDELQVEAKQGSGETVNMLSSGTFFSAYRIYE